MPWEYRMEGVWTFDGGMDAQEEVESCQQCRTGLSR